MTDQHSYSMWNCNGASTFADAARLANASRGDKLHKAPVNHRNLQGSGAAAWGVWAVASVSAMALIGVII